MRKEFCLCSTCLERVKPYGEDVVKFYMDLCACTVCWGMLVFFDDEEFSLKAASILEDLGLAVSSDSPVCESALRLRAINRICDGSLIFCPDKGRHD